MKENSVYGQKGSIRTLIIGAGIAGLTLAALMKKRGDFPVVIERAEKFDHLGYMLGLYYLGSRVLHGLQLFNKFREDSNEMHSYRICSGEGKLIKSYDLQKIFNISGPIQGIKRANLIKLLKDSCSDLDIRMGTTVETFEQKNQEVNVTFNNNSTETFDLVVAADGLHSSTRKMIWDKDELCRSNARFVEKALA